ncbi:hypothetical protein ACS0TY_013971 [Phlomoides rotata]
MEKQSSKSKDKILRFLPKSVSFQNRSTFSPGRNRRSSPMIPAEARVKSKNFETQEPTSPKISCMGQIKHKNKICKMKHAPLPNEIRPASYTRPEKFSKARSVGPGSELKKKPTGIKKLFSASRKSVDVSFDNCKPPLPERAPSLSQMRRFASSRDTLANFDWTNARIAPEYDSDGDSDGEDDAVVPLTAGAGKAAGSALEPRKEINLWKRRTMAQPKPLQLNIVRAQ